MCGGIDGVSMMSARTASSILIRSKTLEIRYKVCAGYTPLRSGLYLVVKERIFDL